MPNQRRTANQRRTSPPAPLGNRYAGERSPKDPFIRWITIILALHVIGLTLFFLSMRNRADAELALEKSSTTPPPTERPADPYAQKKFFDLIKKDPNRLPVLPTNRNPTDASSDIVLPDSEQVAELRRLEEQVQQHNAEVAERLQKIRHEREQMEAEAKAIAEAEKKRVAALELERLRKLREAEQEKKAEALAAKKREQQRIAKQKAEALAAAKAKADAAARAAAEAKAKAARLAAQEAAGNRSSSGGNSTTSGSGSGSTADMGWYNNAVLGPAFFSAWNQPAGPDYTGKNFSASVRITVRKDGRVIKAEIIRSSGNTAVDASVRAALNRVTQLAPLPRAYRQSTYSETINFALDS